MSTISAITYDDAFVYTPGISVLTSPAAAFMTQTAGTLTVTTQSGRSVTMTVIAGIIYPLVWKSISLGTVTGAIIAFQANPFKGST